MANELTFTHTDGSSVSFVVPTPRRIVEFVLHTDPDVDPEDLDDIVESTPLSHRVWWFNDPNCDGSECRCGQIPLYEVVGSRPSEEHARIVTAHVLELRAAWRHLWDADALMSQQRPEVFSDTGVPFGDMLCVSCLADGPAHGADLLTETQALSLDLGEALTVYPAIAVHIPTSE